MTLCPTIFVFLSFSQSTVAYFSFLFFFFLGPSFFSFTPSSLLPICWCLRKNGLKKKKINWNLEKNWRQTFPSVLIQSKPSKYTARRIIFRAFFARIILSDLSIYNPFFFFIQVGVVKIY